MLLTNFSYDFIQINIITEVVRFSPPAGAFSETPSTDTIALSCFENLSECRTKSSVSSCCVTNKEKKSKKTIFRVSWAVNLIDLSCTRYRRRQASWWRPKHVEVKIFTAIFPARRLNDSSRHLGLPQNFEKIETIREMSKKSACDNNNDFRWEKFRRKILELCFSLTPARLPAFEFCVTYHLNQAPRVIRLLPDHRRGFREHQQEAEK